MSGLLVAAIIFTGLAVFAVLAVRFGVDSRVDSGDPHRSGYPIGIE